MADLFGTYAKRIKITIDHNDIDSDLTWFPVTVFLTATQGEEVFAEFDADEDFDRIAFTTSDEETQIYADCELFDDSEQKAIYHVSKTGWTVSSSVDTDIYLYYDNNAGHNTTYISKSGDTAAQSVWDSNFVTVHHMDNAEPNIVTGVKPDYWGSQAAATAINFNNPTTATGTIDNIQFYVKDTMNGLVFASFYRPDPGSYPNNWTARDKDTSHNSTEYNAGLHEVSVDISVQSGDYIGCYYSSGSMERHLSGYDGIYYKSGDYTEADNDSFSFFSGDCIAVLGFSGSDSPILVKDATSNNLDGTKINIGGPALTTSGKVGNCQSFDGTDDYIETSDDAALDTGAYNTTEVIFKTDTENQDAKGIVLHDHSDWKYMIWLTGKSGNVGYFIKTASGNTQALIDDDDNTYADDTYRYFAGVFDKTLGSNRIVLYENGSSAASANGFNEDITAGDEGITIARYTTTNLFNGEIDEIRISNNARSAAWIAATYDSLFDTLLSYGSEETEGEEEAETNVLFLFANF